MNYDRPELRDRLASEYVLGTLHGSARKRFQRLMKNNAAIRVAVEVWEQKLMPMSAPLAMDVATDKLWRGIEKRIAAPRYPAAASPRWFERWFGGFTLRTVGAIAAGVIVGVMGTLLAVQLDPITRVAVPAGRAVPETYAGFLADRQGNPTLLVSSLRHGAIIDLKILRPISIQPDHVLNLWALAPNKPPVLLGVIPTQGKAQLTMSDTSERLLATVTELAVSVEPAPGVRGNLPTEPYLLRGPCAKFW
jgi:anti-sigma-K factor RskA